MISLSLGCLQKDKKTVVSAGLGLAGLSCELWRLQGVRRLMVAEIAPATLRLHTALSGKNTGKCVYSLP